MNRLLLGINGSLKDFKVTLQRPVQGYVQEKLRSATLLTLMMMNIIIIGIIILTIIITLLRYYDEHYSSSRQFPESLSREGSSQT